MSDVEDEVCLTHFPDMLVKPMNANDNNYNVDKPQICQDWGKIKVNLLISFQSLYINAENAVI